PMVADGYCPGDIKGLVQDRLMQASVSKRGILHLDPLQKRPTNSELRQIQATQVPALLAQQCYQIGRSIPLGFLRSSAELVEQRLYHLLHRSRPQGCVLQTR